MAKAMKNVMQGVLADALQARSPKHQRKLKKQQKELNLLSNITLEDADTARLRSDKRWNKQRKQMKKSGISKSDKEWKAARKAHNTATKVWLKQMKTIIK